MNTKKEIKVMTPDYCIRLGSRKLENIEKDPYAYAAVLEELRNRLTGGRRITFEEELETIVSIDSALFDMFHHDPSKRVVELDGREIEMRRDRPDGIVIVMMSETQVTLDCTEY